LYYNPIKVAKISKKRKRSGKKKRITELKKILKYKRKAGYIICMDTIVIHLNGLKRYIFTTVDKYGKMAYTGMYKSKSTINSKDFLYRLNYLMDDKIKKVGHDNKTKFEKYFKIGCKELKINQYYSRVKTPKDNATNERFNRTLKEEFMGLGNFSTDPFIFNSDLTEWLIEYNFYSPPQALGYKTPVDYLHLSPMSSSDRLC
jgi:IS30 family transposase